MLPNLVTLSLAGAGGEPSAADFSGLLANLPRFRYSPGCRRELGINYEGGRQAAYLPDAARAC